MCCLINNGNNLHLKKYARDERPDRKLIKVNTIEYDVKSWQVMTTIVNCIDVPLKTLKILAAHRRYVYTVNEYVIQMQYFK